MKRIAVLCRAGMFYHYSVELLGCAWSDTNFDRSATTSTYKDTKCYWLRDKDHRRGIDFDSLVVYDAQLYEELKDAIMPLLNMRGKYIENKADRAIWVPLGLVKHLVSPGEKYVFKFRREDIGCNHEWVEYQGFNDCFEFCKHCDEKRNENEMS